jgi:signal transduction histidine kinase
VLLKRKDTKSINQINYTAILFAGFFAFVFACLIIVNEYMEFQKEIKRLEENYIQTQKRSAQSQMDQLWRIVEYRFEQSKTLPKEELYVKLKEDLRALFTPLDETHYIFIQRDDDQKTLYRSAPMESEQASKDILVSKAYAPLGLSLYSGVKTSSIEDVLAQKHKEYEEKIINFIVKTYMLTLVMYMVSTVEYRYVSDIMTREIRFIVESFKEASRNYHFIDMQKIKFKEFQEIVSHANAMIEEIRDKNNALMSLNSNLEHIVEQKTEELKRSIAYTQELLEKQDRFVKNAIHEINTPLSIILMNIDLYNLKFEKNPYLVKIEAAVKVLDNIYEDLAYVVKKDRVTYTKAMIDFSKFLLERVAYFEDVAEGNKLTIQTEIEPDLFIVFNEIELQRICDNNLSNAIKYSFEKESLHVRLYAHKKEVVFEVENRGEKIKSPKLLFSRYYRENDVRGGFGLGLNIVKEICDHHHVGVEVYSDETTRFVYRFAKG